MDKNEILMIYGTDYAGMTLRLLDEADLAGMIIKKCLGGTENAAQVHGEIEKKGTAPGCIAHTGIRPDALESIRIGIKPNLVNGTPASEGATTHVELIEALVIYLKEHGFSDITVMESSWVGGNTAESFETCGYNEMARRQGVKLIDVKKEKAVRRDCGGMELEISECAGKVDYLINVPVMKGHCQTLMTCALKNMKGMLPDREKRHFHAMGLHKPIAHLALGIHQDFILVDSICGDMSFEDGGNPHVMNRIFAAADPVLCDAFACRLMGKAARDVEYIMLAESLGAGSSDIENASVRELNSPVCDTSMPDTDRIVRLKDMCEEVESCSACYGYLIPALAMLDSDGLLHDFPEKICIGMGFRGKSGLIGIGNCTKGFKYHLPGCPPTENQMYGFLKGLLDEGKL